MMQLNGDELHVWLARLEVDPQQLVELKRALSPDELERADNFYFERDRRSFIAARGILRTLLARYLAAAPSALRFDYNEFGKPRLAGAPENCDLRFNLSHSGGLALVAIALARDVGVDIEAIDNSVGTEEIAKNFFSTGEVSALQHLPQSLRLMGFFNCWTRKEAYIKARGMGLSIPLDSFDVSLHPDEPADLIRTAEPSDRLNWKIENLEIDEQFAAAVAAAGRNWKVSQRRWLPAVH